MVLCAFLEEKPREFVISIVRCLDNCLCAVTSGITAFVMTVLYSHTRSSLHSLPNQPLRSLISYGFLWSVRIAHSASCRSCSHSVNHCTASAIAAVCCLALEEVRAPDKPSRLELFISQLGMGCCNTLCSSQDASSTCGFSRTT